MIRSLPITAFSLVNSLGVGDDAVAAGLARREAGLRPVAGAFDLPFETVVGAVDDTGFSELDGDLADWSTRSARIAARLIVEIEDPIRRARERWGDGRCAVIMGTSTAGADRTEAAYRQFIATGALPEDYDLWRHHTYGAVLHVIRELTGMRGPAYMLSTACTSSAKPLASAARLIASGAIDAALVGGIDTLCAMTLMGFHALGALDTSACRPFAADRAGISIGEGGAVMLLERAGDARVVLEGVGETSDAYHVSAPHPQGDGARRAMLAAIQAAEVLPSDIDFINAHGTGTRLNDAAEAMAIEAVCGTDVPVVSTKGYTGHTLGAAGATEAVLTAIGLERGEVPASVGATTVDEKIRIHVAANGATGRYRRAISNSFAFGGNNVSVLLRVP